MRGRCSGVVYDWMCAVPYNPVVPTLTPSPSLSPCRTVSLPWHPQDPVVDDGPSFLDGSPVHHESDDMTGCVAICLRLSSSPFRALFRPARASPIPLSRTLTRLTAFSISHVPFPCAPFLHFPPFAWLLLVSLQVSRCRSHRLRQWQQKWKGTGRPVPPVRLRRSCI